MAGAQPRRMSTLELFHPTGAAPRVLVLGGRDAAALVAASARDSGEPADLVVVAPTRAERTARGWVEGAAQTIDGVLAEDGVAFVVAPQPWRRRLLRAVRAKKLVVGPTLLHFPSLRASRHVVGGAAAARYATACLVAPSSWRGRLVSLAARVPGGLRLVAQADVTSVVVRRRDAAPLFRWLFEVAGDAPAEGIVLTRTWREDGGTFTVSVVAADTAAPTQVARVGSPPAAARETLGEERALALLGRGAADAGAVVPRYLGSTQLETVPVAVETGVPGRVAASALAERRGDVPAVLDRVLAWLLRWNRSTATRAALTPSLLEDEVLRPARLVAGALPGGDDHVRFLERLCDEVTGAEAALTAAHDDLTMTNVLLGENGSIGVVDWDTARATALPLADFFYTVVDAHSASERYADRVRAFSNCIPTAGRHAEDVRARLSSFTHALGVTPAVRLVSLHACWLHHAANELARGETDGPFVQIVRLLADDTGTLAQ